MQLFMQKSPKTRDYIVRDCINITKVMFGD